MLSTNKEGHLNVKRTRQFLDELLEEKKKGGGDYKEKEAEFERTQAHRIGPENQDNESRR